MSAVINSPPTTPVDTQAGDGTLYPPSEGWRAFFSAAWTICNSLTESGTTAQRPTSLLWAGRRFFDTTLGAAGEPIWRNKDNTGWVTLTGGGGGSGTVTSIGTTSPITGGPITTTGTIGINQASASQDGYLSAADWTTFNNKGNGTVTSVSVAIALDDTVTQSGSPITTSGTSTLTAVDAGSADALVGWDDSAGKKVYFTLGTGLTTTGTVLSFSGTAGHAIEDEGVALTQRATLNFVGAGVTATDAGGKTVVTIAGAGTVSLVAGTTPITSGTAGRVLFEGAGNVLQEDAGLTYDAATDALTTTILTLGTVSAATGLIKLANASSANLTTIQAGNAVAARTYTWPTDFGASGTVLTDAAGNGTLSWTTSSATVRLDQIATGTADSTLTTSGTITMTSGAGAANTVGKTIAIQPGAGGAGTAVGGVLTLTGGTGTGNGIAGGAVTITGGTAAGTATTGGAVNLVGGTGILGGAINITSGGSTISGGNTGGVVIAVATSSGSNAVGGAVTITAGASTSSQIGGVATITAGTGGTGGAASLIGGAGTSGGGGTGGLSKIQGGVAAAAASSIGGGASVLGGAGSTTTTGGAGGAITVQGGTGGLAAAGGAVTVQGGTAGATGNGGAVSVVGGTAIAGNGANVSITASAGVGTNKPGGNVVIRPGAATGSGNPGNIQLDGGSNAALATTAIGGFVTIPTCAGAPTGVPVNVPTGSVAMVYDTTNNKLMVYNGAWKGVVLT